MIDGAAQTPSKRLRNSPNKTPGETEAASDVSTSTWPDLQVLPVFQFTLNPRSSIANLDSARNAQDWGQEKAWSPTQKPRSYDSRAG